MSKDEEEQDELIKETDIGTEYKSDEFNRIKYEYKLDNNKFISYLNDKLKQINL